jgi:hypothetical protein
MSEETPASPMPPTDETKGRTIKQAVHGNPFDPGERSATIVKPGELIDVIEITP